ncbi:MAG: prepilin-type N-terminal cleavage/methylation domain-containing protein [Nitrosomonadales bacterium]|jgi:prepilin-type N-terminal cleavage/methylation domain-containing protein|nr:MAG: prepilin-type N-terminal cleavage/methylation domain-containing protein [Nitrosomonadales bacterium]
MSRNFSQSWHYGILTWKRAIPRSVQYGFSLIEMAVVMVILAMLIGGLIAPLTAQIDQRNMNETRDSISEIKKALIGFAVTTGRLPCPAVSAVNGDEKVTCIALADRHGYIPWAKLGVPKLDAWGHMFRYSVTSAYAGPAGTLVLSPPTIRDITIQTRDIAGTLVNVSTPSNIPAVVLSHGKNGYGSTDDQGVVTAVPSVNIDESTNTTDPTTFVTQVPAAAGTPGGEYDDIVTWISPNILFSNMVAAGRLP